MATVIIAVKASLAAKHFAWITPESANFPVLVISSCANIMSGGVPSLPGNLGFQMASLINLGAVVSFSQSGALSYAGQSRPLSLCCSILCLLLQPPFL